MGSNSLITYIIDNMFFVDCSMDQNRKQAKIGFSTPRMLIIYSQSEIELYGLYEMI